MTAVHLTNRELEIAKLISQGLPNKEIATRLFIAERTVKVHIVSIITKLRVGNRVQIAVWCVCTYGCGG